MRRLPFVAVALMLAVAGCSSSPSASDTPSPTQPTAATTTSDPTPAAPSSAAPDATCLHGRYTLIRFVGVGAKGTYGTDEGGDVTITFDNESYLMRGAGKDPIKLTLAGQTADLLVNGTISGDHQVEGNKANFTVDKSAGSATLSTGSSKESVSIDEVSSVLAPSGEAGLACAKDALVISLQDVRLEFGKV